MILIFGGTTEGRELAEILSKNGIFCELCVATEYGEMVVSENEFLKINRGRLSASDMKDKIEKEEFKAVIDATHPYATLVSENIIKAVLDTNIPFYRLERGKSTASIGEYSYFDDMNSCAKALENTTGNILLTTGSKELTVFSNNDKLKERLVVRVLPGRESLDICLNAGINVKNIIAMQGPFSQKLNEAIIKDYNIKNLVTKESGIIGGFGDKLMAADNTGTSVFIVRRPEYIASEKEMDFNTILKCILELEGKELTYNNNSSESELKIALIGIGMGDVKCLTSYAKDTIKNADIIFGAERMLDTALFINSNAKTFPYYLSKDIIPVIEENENLSFAVLFSGDLGFFSGAERLSAALLEKFGNKADISIIPGISSISYLSAKTGISWQDAKIISAHGTNEDKWLPEIIRSIIENKKTFFITSSALDIKSVMANIQNSEVTFFIGYNLSYEDEKIVEIKSLDEISFDEKGLYSVFAINNKPVKKIITPFLTDEDFIRGSVPMTKEEIRKMSICKMALTENSVVYDIGSGTGSVSVEMAMLSPDISVYAIESNDEAFDLTVQNVNHFGLKNVKTIKSLAPEGLENLPKATHAFIGGTRGRLNDILHALYSINSKMHIVINAVSIESVAGIINSLHEYNILNLDIAEITVAKTRTVGGYNMLDGRNPVFIFSFDFAGE